VNRHTCRKERKADLLRDPPSVGLAPNRFLCVILSILAPTTPQDPPELRLQGTLALDLGKSLRVRSSRFAATMRNKARTRRTLYNHGEHGIFERSFSSSSQGGACS